MGMSQKNFENRKLRAIGIDLGTTNLAAAESLLLAARFDLEHFQRFCTVGP
jgi:hypothetical protein